MSSSSTGASPIPKQPVGRTFVAAILALGLFAALQILAVVNYYLPTVARELTSASQEKAAPQAAATPQPDQQVKPYRPTVRQPTAEDQQVALMLTESDRMYRVGDYENMLDILTKADQITPDAAGVQLRLAQVYERMDRIPDASAAYSALLKHPELPPSLRSQAESKADAVPNAAVGSGPAVREDNGLQPGSVLGITDVRIREDKPGFKNLRVAVKSRHGSEISPIDVKIFVYFYEKAADGEIVLTESTPVTQWIGTDVDWKTDEPELLDVEYPMPETGREYYGYVVAVYYNKELQDSQADPGPLAEKFEIPLYLKYEQDAQ
jgi:hypothetical protein